MAKNKLTIDTKKLQIQPIRNRVHDLNLSIIEPLKPCDFDSVELRQVAKEISLARKKCASIVMMMGAHVIRSGVQRYIIDLMENGYISCIAMNGAGVIHDFEFALIGATTESVARYIKNGEFGMWRETGKINDTVNKTVYSNSGFGEAVGQEILEGDYPHKDISLLAQAWKNKIPVTVHVGIGYDIIHQHPNFDGAATGAASYRDFLKFAEILLNLENGVVLNFGSAVMAPEVFLKALSMARNIAEQNGKSIGKFTTLVCDLHEMPGDYSIEPSKDSPGYYFRPWKTMIVRTTLDGGKGYYVKGRHEETIPALWSALKSQMI